MQTQHRFSRLHLGGLTASACPLPSPGRRQNHYIPMEFILGCRRLRSKSLLAFAYANATPLFSTPPRRVNRLGLPIALAGQASKPLHPHGIYFRVQTAPLEKPACICLCKRNTAFLPLRRRAG